MRYERIIPQEAPDSDIFLKDSPSSLPLSIEKEGKLPNFFNEASMTLMAESIKYKKKT